MNYAKIRKLDVTNGPGIRTTLFVSGCTHNCEGCFNKEQQDFNYGNKFTKETEDEFIQLTKNKQIKGVNILGGEPMQQIMDDTLLNLLKRIKLETDKPIWLWSGYTFEEIVNNPKRLEILREVLVSKPWHYSDCRLQEYFWESAQKTSVYAEIRKVLESYTDEERKRDAESCDRLMQTAKDEIAKENNYLNLVKTGKLKSKDRLEVLEKIALYEREGRFGEDVEEDPPTRELQPSEIDYLRKKLKSRIKTRLTYKVARTFLNKIIENKQLIIKDVIGTEHMDALTSGAVITCNHFNAFDSFAMQIAYEKSKQCKKRRLYRVIREGNYTNFPGFYGMLMRNCYTFPLSSNRDTMKKFLSSMDTVLQHGDFMLVYPEQSMWWNYRKPKPLKKGAYTFAAKNHVPVLPCFITMEDSDILGDDGFYVQEYTIHIAEPIYPDPQKTQAENVDAMRRKNAAVWKQIYEEFYGIPLVYDTAEAVQYVGKPTNIA